MERNVVRNSGLSRQRILTEEEWSRINEHFLALENLKKQPKINDSGKIKTRVLLAGRPHRTLQYHHSWAKECTPHDYRHRQAQIRILKHCGTENEQTRAETLPEMEPAGRPLTSEKYKEEIISRAKRILFENKDYARRLLHGLRLSSVLHERNIQMDFSRRLRNMMNVAEREFKTKLREEAKKYEEEIVRDKMKRKENSEKLRMELDKQICQKIEGRQREELEKAREGNDIIKMNEELKALLEREREEKEKKKEKLKKDIENYKKSEREIRAKLRMKEKEEEEVNKIYQSVAWEIDKRRRDKEKARFGKTMKVEKDIFQDVKEPLKIHSDGDKKLKSFLLMREARKKTLLNDIFASKKMAEEEMERRRNEEKSERRKCAAERCRKAEADRLRNLQEKEEKRKVMNDMRKYYIMQWMEKQKLRKEEKEVDNFYAPNFSEENKMIGEFCDEVLGMVKRNRRPVFPVAAAVKDVKKEFGLEPVRNINFLKSNVPIGK